MTILRAIVRRVTGHTRHTLVEPGRTVELPPGSLVRIVPDDAGAYLLLRFTEGGAAISDTWHATIAEAKRQALVEYDIAETDWHEEAN